MKFLNRTFLFVLILLTALIRWRMNSTDYLVAGVDGTYYPLQVRSLMENFRLGYPDMPLVFFIEAMFAKIFYLSGMAENESILFAVKFVDSFIPPLAALPVFFIAKELNKNNKAEIFVFIVTAFSILNIFPYSLTGNYTKNSIAVILMFFNIHFVIRLLKYSLRKDFYLLVFTLFLCGLTHFGSFSVLFLTDLLFLSVWSVITIDTFNTTNHRNLILGISALVLLLMMISVFDIERFRRMLSFPFRIFEAPIILFVLKGFKSSMEGPRVFYLIIANIFALAGLALVFIKGKAIDKPQKVIVLTSSILTLILSSPFIGIEWEERLLNLSYVPLTILFLSSCHPIKSQIIKYFIMLFCFGLAFLPYVRGIPQTLKVNISQEAYDELEEINRHNFIGNKSVIIARQDLRMTAGWVFKTKTIADFYFNKNDFGHYDGVYILKQKGKEFDHNLSAQFKEPFVSPDSHKIYDGKNFEIYKLDNADHWNIGIMKPLKLFGRITEGNANRFFVKNDNVCRPVEISNATKLHLSNNKTELNNGMLIQVWGSNRIFDLTIDAELIQEVGQEPED